MARILDSERIDDTQQQEEQETEEQVTQQEPETEVPDKYRGKSAEELVQMHQEAEKLLGRQSSEVGELRKVVDQYINSQLTPEEKAPQQVEEVDFFTEPDKAIDQRIENHPKVKEAEALSKQYRQSTALAELQRKHPDMKAILQDASFAEWIKASPVRTRLFVAADQQYDHESADELFSLWKERKQLVGQTAQAEKNSRREAVKSANTGNARGSSESNPKKIYRRADIIKLMKEDPHRYAALQPEIMRAYAEKRVR
jgi:hypothetical protein|tara:strand:- start:709 stop:1476 length:768 start_codon:yes stop_codon:yes gene_type:complete